MQKITAFVIAAVFSIFFLQPKTANAVTLTDFNFTGTCTVGCNGTATATLVLQNYTIGNVLSNTNFVSFAYHSDFFGDITVNDSNFILVAGQFVSLPGGASVEVRFATSLQVFDFLSSTSGLWCVGPNCIDDSGTNGQWSVAPPVPLPAALPLFATGLGALGLLGWRRKRKAQAAA